MHYNGYMNGTILGIISINSLIFIYRSNISIILSHRVTTYLTRRRGVDFLSSVDMIGDFNFVIIVFTFSIRTSSSRILLLLGPIDGSDNLLVVPGRNQKDVYLLHNYQQLLTHFKGSFHIELV